MRIKLHWRDQRRFLTKVVITTDNKCWEWIGTKNPGGYGKFGVNGTVHRAHRVAYALVFGKIPKNAVICHHCDNPLCCNPAHLFAGTPGDNNTDRHTKGRSGDFVGTKNPNVKLTEKKVRKIKRLLARGLSSRKIGGLVKISAGMVNNIKHHRNWTHI